MLKSRITGTISCGFLAAAAYGGSLGPLFLLSGSVTIEDGDVYNKLYVGDTAEVIMNGGEVLGEALAITGGRIELNGGTIRLTPYSMSGSFTASVSEFVVRGGELQGTAFGVGGASNVTIEATEFYVDADRDGVSETRLETTEGVAVINAQSEFYAAGENQPIVGLRWVYPDGTEETVNVPIIAADDVWTGSITLVDVGFFAGDFDGDGSIASGDLGVMLAEWGRSGSFADLDGDGVVASGDLGVLLAAWGLTP